MLPPIRPIKIKDRVSLVFIEKGQVDVIDGAFVVVDEAGIRSVPRAYGDEPVQGGAASTP